MKVTAQFAMWASIVFAILCGSVGLNGLSKIDAMADEAGRADARGYALFWLFLAAVAVASALASWWMARRADDDPPEP
jgi:hypothetical protein